MAVSSGLSSERNLVIGAARIVLHLAGAQSLKDKRRIVKSLLAGVQREYVIAAAEVERQDQWQVAVLGFACVSTSAAHADEVLARAVNFVDSSKWDAELLEYQTETIHAL